MNSTLTMYVTLVTTSGVLSLFLCMYAIVRRADIPGARWFIAMVSLQAIYIFAYAFELTSDQLEMKKLWIIIEYTGIALSPVMGLRLILRYVRLRLPQGLGVALFAIPGLTLLFVATNDWHGFFYKAIELRTDTPFPAIDLTIGSWYIVHGAFTFGCLLAGAILLLRQWSQTGKAYRLQLITLISGQVLPMVTAFLYLLGFAPNGIDPVPFVMCITSAMYIWAIVSVRMLTVVPTAKDQVFDSMREGAIVLDSAERLLDYNRAVGRMLPSLHPGMIGSNLDDVWTSLTGSAFPIKGRLDHAEEEMTWTTADGGASHFLVRTSPIRARDGEQAGILLMLIDVTEQRKLQEQLRQMAYYDSLTGIYNRAQFNARAEALLEADRSSGRSTSLVLFDIDRFKEINDTYGHAIGDRVITHVAAVCRRLLPDDAVFARYGGEEFAVALPATPLTEAARVAERIRSALADQPLETEGRRIVATASFGVTESPPADGSLETMLRQADHALYAAKRAGRNVVRLFSVDRSS